MSLLLIFKRYSPTISDLWKKNFIGCIFSLLQVDWKLVQIRHIYEIHIRSFIRKNWIQSFMEGLQVEDKSCRRWSTQKNGQKRWNVTINWRSIYPTFDTVTRQRPNVGMMSTLWVCCLLHSRFFVLMSLFRFNCELTPKFVQNIWVKGNLAQHIWKIKMEW